MASLRNATLLTFIAIGACASYSSAAEIRVQCSAVPVVVMDAARQQAPHARVRGCVKDSEHGKLAYEVETTNEGRSRDMTFDPSGAVLEVEQELDTATLPQPISQALVQAAYGGRVEKVESVTKGAEVVSYEAVILKGGKKREVAFSREGKPVKAD